MPPKPPRKPPAATTPGDGGGERDRLARRARDRAAGVKEIGPLPPVADPARKARCGECLELFFKTYFARRFPLPFSRDHRKVIRKLERCIRTGGQFALAMPRGSGKTTMLEAAILWAVLYGYRKYIIALAATGDLAADLVAAVKAELETNDLLLADFPEACHPVRALEGIAQRGKGQTLGGGRTRVEWGAGEFRLATVPGAACSGAVVEGYGLDSAIRGRKKPGPDGEQLRPDMLVLDDPQTDESARMLGQTNTRAGIIEGAVLGMAGPGRTVAAIMPCTCICPDDLSDRYLKNPVWNGERTRLVDRMPEALAWWHGEYAEKRRESFQRFGDNRLADDLYRQNRAAADAGADLPWPERFDAAKCQSALQEAMNWKIDRPASFAAEAQNEPLSLNPEGDANAVNATLLKQRLTGVPRGVVPRECSRVTVGLDVSESVLWWVATAWDERFGGSVIDYGCYPEQRRTYFRQAEAQPSLRAAFPGQPVEACVFAGLSALFAHLLARDWPTEAGGTLPTDRLLVDSGDRTKEVFDAIRAAPQRGRITPTKGFGVSAHGVPVREWPKFEPERRGQDWVFNPKSGGRWLLKFGAHEWKTFLAARLRTPPGAAGCLRLFGDDPVAHDLFGDHCAAEAPVRDESEGRVVHVWKERPGRENHLFDCAVLATLAASFAGLKWSAAAAAAPPGTAPAAVPRRTHRWVDIDELNRAANPGG